MEYNYMDLPLKIEIEGSTVYNTYDAKGRKLRSKILSNNPDHPSVTYDYMDGIEYKDESLEAIYHSEGRYIIDKDNGNYYEFFLKDHLGNTRVRFADQDNNGILDIEPVEVLGQSGEANMEYQEYLGAKSYYPFGMAFSHNVVTTEDGNLYWVGEEGGVENRYTYNGKELVDDLDINLHDYGARYYDQAIARWTSVDPVAEAYAGNSGYAYVANNPLIFIDPTGAIIEHASDEAKALYQSIYDNANDDIKKIYDNLHSSDVVYRIALTELVGDSGVTEFGSNQDKEGALVIDILIDSGASGDEQIISLGDELEHARQFEEGHIGFIVGWNGQSSPSLSYDYGDEVFSQEHGLRALEDVKGLVTPSLDGNSAAAYKKFKMAGRAKEYVLGLYGDRASSSPNQPGSRVAELNNHPAVKTTVYRKNGKTIRHDN